MLQIERKGQAENARRGVLRNGTASFQLWFQKWQGVQRGMEIASGADPSVQECLAYFCHGLVIVENDGEIAVVIFGMYRRRGDVQCAVVEFLVVPLRALLAPRDIGVDRW